MYNRNIPLVVMCTLGALVLVRVAALAVDVWTGASGPGGDNNFTTDANWFDNSSPNANDDVVIDETTPRDTVVIDEGPHTVRTLFVGNGHHMDLEYKLTVKGEARFEGTVTLKNTVQEFRNISAHYVVVNARTLDTVIQFEGAPEDELILDTLQDT